MDLRFFSNAQIQESQRRAGGMAQVVEHLPNKHKTLSSNHQKDKNHKDAAVNTYGIEYTFCCVDCEFREINNKVLQPEEVRNNYSQN
jgi:hypothetical protein